MGFTAPALAYGADFANKTGKADVADKADKTKAAAAREAGGKADELGSKANNNTADDEAVKQDTQIIQEKADNLITAKPSLLSAAINPQAVIGEVFVDDTDEGAYVRYKVTSAGTVQVGVGSKAGQGNSTIDPNYSGRITIPEWVERDGVRYTVSAISDYAFALGGNFDEPIRYMASGIILPPTIKTIGKMAFSECSISSITIPAAVNYLGDEAFKANPVFRSNLRQVKFAAGSKLTFFSAKLFENCELNLLDIPESVTSIESNAFLNVQFDGDILVLPQQLSSIGEYAFRESSLQNVSIPAAVTTLGNGAFYKCQRLSKVAFANGSKLVELPTAAFSGCTSNSNHCTAQGRAARHRQDWGNQGYF
jgi:hypothetical protein